MSQRFYSSNKSSSQPQRSTGLPPPKNKFLLPSLTDLIRDGGHTGGDTLWNFIQGLPIITASPELMDELTKLAAALSTAYFTLLTPAQLLLPKWVERITDTLSVLLKCLTA